MEVELYQSLLDLKFPTNLKGPENLQEIISTSSYTNYCNLISDLSKALQAILKTEEYINAIESDKHLQSFALEMNSFLKEIGCPYKAFYEGKIEDRLQCNEHKLLLLNYLISELQASKMLLTSGNFTNNSKNQLKTLNESPTAMHLRLLFKALKFPKPSSSITASVLFSKLIPKVQEIINAPGMKDKLGKPLLSSTETRNLTSEEWNELERLTDSMKQEYRMRKNLLLTRVDVTIESFTWSQRLKEKRGLIMEHYEPKRSHLSDRIDITVADILAGRNDLLKYEKTSDSKVRQNTRSKINKVLIGRVPDRGGRPSETEAPPPEIPSWKKDQQNQHQGRGGGARVQGNWQQQNTQRGGDFQRYGGGAGANYSGNVGAHMHQQNQYGGNQPYGNSNYANQGYMTNQLQHPQQNAQQFIYNPNPTIAGGNNDYYSHNETYNNNNLNKRTRGGGLGENQQYHSTHRGGRGGGQRGGGRRY